jgi:hypothetical protein
MTDARVGGSLLRTEGALIMAKRTTTPSPPQPAVLSASQIKAAIPKLERRLRELEQVRIDHWDDEVQDSLAS